MHDVSYQIKYHEFKYRGNIKNFYSVNWTKLCEEVSKDFH